MNFQELSRFVAVVDAGSLNRAASALRISQPTLSVQMAQMEADLRVRLFIRTRRGVTPTDAGQALYREAQSILRNVKEIPKILSSSVLEPTGQVTVGFSASLAAAFGIPFLDAIRQAYPKIMLQILEAPATMQRELAANNRIDFALVLAEIDNRDPFLTPAYRQRLYAVAPAGARKSMTLPQLLKMPLVLPSKENPIRLAFDRAVEAVGGKPTIRAECRSLTILLQAVRAGIGYAILPWIPCPIFGEKKSLFQFIDIVGVELDLLVAWCEATDRTSSAVLIAKNALQETIVSRIRQPDWRGAAL